jgi:hypothetical protein
MALSKRLTEELEHLKLAILAMDFNAENESMKKCFDIGIHEDGLTATFVCNRINAVLQGTT